MSIITRAKNILLTPATEWGVISMETESPGSLLGKYVIPMSLIPAVCTFIGWGLIGVNVGFVRIGSMEWGLTKGHNKLCHFDPHLLYMHVYRRCARSQFRL